MDKKLEDALGRVEMNYHDLVEIANGILDPVLNPVNELVDALNAHINSLSIDQLRDYILRLQLKAFEISEIKEKSILKAELADALHEEAFAVNFNGTDGSAAVKDKLALVATASETVSDTLYSYMANLLKNKVDQLHRLVAAISSILMSRMQDLKYTSMSAGSGQVDSPAPTAE